MSGSGAPIPKRSGPRRTFLAARVQLKLDAESRRAVAARIVYPHYLAPAVDARGAAPSRQERTHLGSGTRTVPRGTTRIPSSAPTMRPCEFGRRA
jgi:type VI protein secretion system component VasA